MMTTKTWAITYSTDSSIYSQQLMNLGFNMSPLVILMIAMAHVDVSIDKATLNNYNCLHSHNFTFVYVCTGVAYKTFEDNNHIIQ